MNKIKIIKNILTILEIASIDLMQYNDDNEIKYEYKIFEFKKKEFYIIDTYYNEVLFILNK